MTNITNLFFKGYEPRYGILIRQHILNEEEYYLESFDVDAQGKPINAHPLSDDELLKLAHIVRQATKTEKYYLKSASLLPDSIVYLDSMDAGRVIWHTHAQERELYFDERLAIPSGKASVPALLWVASEDDLRIFALMTDQKPTLQTILWSAPFFNIHENGLVCMGTIDINAQASRSLEDFMSQWENYFFKSYFSHLINGHKTTKGNIVLLWKEQVTTNRKFPIQELVKSPVTMKNLLS